MELDDNYLVVCAIDFGTTFSGYAFSYKTTPTTVVMNKNWGAGAGVTSMKTPTSVLMRPDGTFDSFGYEAESEYLQHGPEENYEIYRCFKMILHDEDLSMDCEVESARGHKTRAIDIFARSLEYLKNHMLDAVDKTTTTGLKDGDIRWVLTVPAIWSEKAKNFMKTAAYKAGLIKDVTDPSLLISLEPEAASYFCREMILSAFAEGVDVPDGGKFRAGDKLLVIDAGGGTVDITGHEIQIDGKVKELVPPSGGPWGGLSVNKKFFASLTEIFSKDFIQCIKKNSPQSWLDFGAKFESVKKNVSPDGNKKTRISIPHEFFSEYQELKKEDLAKAINRFNDEGVSFRDGFLVIEPEKARACFEESCKKTVKRVKTLIKKPQFTDLKYILLVGGYGQSPMLYDACVKAFSSKCKILVPTDAQSAIAQGAVLYGHRPNAIAVRKAKATYGYKASLPFKEGLHDASKKIISKRDGKARCKGAFSIFVRKDDELKNPEERVFTIHPKSKTERSTSVQILRSEQDNVLYHDSDGVSPLGNIKIKSKEDFLGNDIRVKITFGHTEILVEATDTSGGTLEKAYLDFN